MPSARILVATLLAMLAFAGNSVLCRLALKGGHIDAASFTALRIASGAAVLWLLARQPHRDRTRTAGDWTSALALFVYAAAFSYAYLGLTAATGALLLFGAVQALMIGAGLRGGERLGARQWAGLLCAAAGMLGLLLPGWSTPPLQSSLPMLAAGAAWGVYSLRARGRGDPLRVTAGNFARALPFAAVLGAAGLPWAALDATGLACAVASGALASGLGYAVWYAALPGLRVTSAATVQLSVPVIAALAGVTLLGEALTPRLVGASLAVLGGIALVVLRR
jgi:drug/metabolite transporter (DMT)-like permease